MRSSQAELAKNEASLCDMTLGNRYLVIGGGGSIGQAVAQEILERDTIVFLSIESVNSLELGKGS